MKSIKIDLNLDLPTLELHLFADEHIGDELSDIKRLKKRIEYVRDTPNAFCVLNGDIIDNATRTSIGDCYAQEYKPMEQLNKAVELFGCLSDKIFAITRGNHEARTYKKEGIDLSYLLARQLGLADRYSSASAMIFLRFGKPIQNHGRANGKQLYSIFMNHGTGGGRKEGAKAIRLADMTSIADADIYIHSHTHLPIIFKEGFYRTDFINSKVTKVTKLFVNTASNLEYGGYGEEQEFKPNTTDTPTIYLYGEHKKFEALL